MNINEAVLLLRQSKVRVSKKHSLKQDSYFEELYSQAWFDKIMLGGYNEVEKEFSRRIEEEKKS